MTLLELITNAVANQVPDTECKYPVVIDPEKLFSKVKSKLENPSPASLVVPITNVKPPGMDDLVAKVDKFFKQLKRNFKDANNFDKEIFLASLKGFLTETASRIKVSVDVDPRDDDYTWAAIKKVGHVMREHQVGLLLEVFVAFEMWVHVETMIAEKLVSRSCYLSLILNLMVKRRSDLVVHCIKHAPDIQFYPLLCILKYMLIPPEDAYSTMVLVSREWEAECHLAIKKAKDKSRGIENREVAREAALLLMVAHDNFSISEHCLHYLVASPNIDEVILSSAIRKLSDEEMMSLIKYLSKWLRKYDKFPQARPCLEASTNLMLKTCDWVPKLEDVIRWLGLVVDENFLSLVLLSEFHEEMRSTAGVVSSLAAEARHCCSLASIVEILRNEAKE